MCFNGFWNKTQIADFSEIKYYFFNAENIRKTLKSLKLLNEMFVDNQSRVNNSKTKYKLRQNPNFIHNIVIKNCIEINNTFLRLFFVTIRNTFDYDFLFLLRNCYTYLITFIVIVLQMEILTEKILRYNIRFSVMFKKLKHFKHLYVLQYRS